MTSEMIAHLESEASRPYLRHMIPERYIKGRKLVVCAAAACEAAESMYSCSPFCIV